MNNTKKPDAETLKKWHSDPDNWVWGIFYFNKADPRILPPKRNEAMGWTVNFANPWSIAFFIAVLLAISAIAYHMNKQNES
jgi:uncharacterized membrane protein